MDVVFFKLKSAKDFRSVRVDGPFISVPDLKLKIVESACYGQGKDFDLLISDAITNRDYSEWGLIPRGSSLLIRRVPGLPQKPIVVPNSTEEKAVDAPPVSSPVAPKKVKAEEPDFHDFGPEVLPESKDDAYVSKCGTETEPMDKLKEDAKIKLLVNMTALEGYPCGGFVSAKAIGGRPGGKGCRVLEPKIPPPGYVCHRCQEPGHFIQHCPTNGDPDYDVKLKPITGIPKSMLVASSNGLYKLASGATAILKPNESDFDKEMEGIGSWNNVRDLPPELYCPLCKKVMKDAVLSSKCCLESFCDKCIRDHIISKSMCYCGTKNVLADDLIPNRTLREALLAMLIAKTTSSSRGGSSWITDTSSITDISHKPPSRAFTTTSGSHQGPSSIEDPSFVKKECANNTVTKSSVEDDTKEKRNRMLNESNSSEDVVHGTIIDGNKKRKNKAALPDTTSSMCTITCDPCWPAAPMSIGFDGYASYFGGVMPWINYAPGGIPSRSVYGSQSYNFTPYRESQRDNTTHKEKRSFKDEPLVKSKNALNATGYDDDNDTAWKRRKLPSSYGGYVHGHGRT